MIKVTRVYNVILECSSAILGEEPVESVRKSDNIQIKSKNRFRQQRCQLVGGSRPKGM